MSAIKGIMVNVLRSASFDKNNVSSKYDTMLLVGVAEVFDVNDGEPYLQLVKRNLFGKDYYHAKPMNV